MRNGKWEIENYGGEEGRGSDDKAPPGRRTPRAHSKGYFLVN
jgi:hypothetical protein